MHNMVSFLAAYRVIVELLPRNTSGRVNGCVSFLIKRTNNTMKIALLQLQNIEHFVFFLNSLYDEEVTFGPGMYKSQEILSITNSRIFLTDL